MADRLPVKKTYKLYVGGAFPRSESGRTFDAEGHNVARASRKDIRDAVRAARAAVPAWSGMTAYNRGQVLYRLAEMMETRATDLEPFDEARTRDLMRALSADGRRASALRAFADLRRRLVDELGVGPGPQTRALYVQVLTDDAEKGQGAIPSKVEVRGLVELLRETLAGMPGVDTGAVDRALALVAGQAP